MLNTLKKLSLFICIVYDKIMLLMLIEKVDITNPLLVVLSCLIKEIFTLNAYETCALRIV